MEVTVRKNEVSVVVNGKRIGIWQIQNSSGEKKKGICRSKVLLVFVDYKESRRNDEYL